MPANTDHEKSLAAKAAVQLVKNNQVIGLGTGSTAAFAVYEIAQMVQNGLQVQAVATSEHTAALATSLGIPIIDINTVDQIDITIDGADEFTKELQLMKGGGGALLREKIVASLSTQVVIIADSSKLVDRLGKFTLPIEIIPFASNYVLHQLKKIQGTGNIRTSAGKTFITDSGNYIMDTDFGLIENPQQLADTLNSIVGIVEHGLFINLATSVIMGSGDDVKIFAQPQQ